MRKLLSLQGLKHFRNSLGLKISCSESLNSCEFLPSGEWDRSMLMPHIDCPVKITVPGHAREHSFSVINPTTSHFLVSSVLNEDQKITYRLAQNHSDPARLTFKISTLLFALWLQFNPRKRNHRIFKRNERQQKPSKNCHSVIHIFTHRCLKHRCPH